MRSESISLVEFERHDRAIKATVRRTLAENTWLRHSLLVLKACVTDMATQLTDLETRAKALKSSFPASSASPPDKRKAPRTASPTAKPAIAPKTQSTAKTRSKK